MAQYYYTKNGERHGPIDLPELQELVANQQVGPTEYFWTSGMADWQKVGGTDLFGAPATASETTSPTMFAEPAATSPETAPDEATSAAPAPMWAEPSATPAMAQTFGTPAASTFGTPSGGTDTGAVKRIADKMPKPLWLLVVAIATGLGGLIASLGIITIIFTWAIIWSAVLLFQANTSLETARRTGSEQDLSKAAEKLNTYFMIQGIWIIIGFVVMVGALMVGSVSSFNF